MGIRLVQNASLTYKKDVLIVGLLSQVEPTQGREQGQLPRTHMLGPGSVLMGGAGLHVWGRQSLWGRFKVSSYKISLL